MLEIPIEDLLRFVREDAPFGDITTSAVVPATDCTAVILTREPCVVAGLKEAISLFSYFGIVCSSTLQDGDEVQEGTKLLSCTGSAHSILLLERTVVNLMGRMSGIATSARIVSRKVSRVNPSCLVAVTRKTAPGLRIADKKAAVIGGAESHRFSLSDAILIKDNHLALVPLREAIQKALAYSPYRVVEVEVEDSTGACIAAETGAHIILLDNMSPEEIKKTVDLLVDRGLRNRVKIEISGGISHDTIETYASLPVDIISIGSITHTVRSIDLSLDILPSS